MPWINVDFWEILTLDKKPFDFVALARNVRNLDYSHRIKDRGVEYTDYVEILEISHGQVFGGGARIRKTGLPGCFNLRTGARQPLPLKKEEGLDEGVFFVYDEPLQTLATQRHRVFRASALEKVLADITGSDLHFSPKLRKDKWQRFGKLERIGSVEVKVSNPAYHPEFSEVMPSLGRVLKDAQSEANAVTVDLKLAIGRSRKKSLDLTWARKLLSSLKSSDVENLDALKVKGAESVDEQQETIDFVNDRLVFSSEIEYSTRALSVQECKLKLRQAIEENRSYLKSLL